MSFFEAANILRDAQTMSEARACAGCAGLSHRVNMCYPNVMVGDLLAFEDARKAFIHKACSSRIDVANQVERTFNGRYYGLPAQFLVQKTDVVRYYARYGTTEEVQQNDTDSVAAIDHPKILRDVAAIGTPFWATSNNILQMLIDEVETTVSVWTKAAEELNKLEEAYRFAADPEMFCQNEMNNVNEGWGLISLDEKAELQSYNISNANMNGRSSAASISTQRV